MNPTLATRCQQRQRHPYWRLHPPGPFLVDGDPPTALAVLLQGATAAPAVGSGEPEPQRPASFTEPAGCPVAGDPSQSAAPSASAWPMAAPADRQAPALVEVVAEVLAGAVGEAGAETPVSPPSPGSPGGAVPELEVPAPLQGWDGAHFVEALPGPWGPHLEPPFPAAPAGLASPLSGAALTRVEPPGAWRDPELAAGTLVSLGRSGGIPGEAGPASGALAGASARPAADVASPGPGLAPADWLGTLLWLVLVAIDAGLALAELMQQLRAEPAPPGLAALAGWGRSRPQRFASLRLGQPLGS